MENLSNYFCIINDTVRANCIKAIQSLPEGYEVVIRKKDKKRTNRQNSFYWGPWLQTFVDWMGEKDKDYLHKEFKVKFLGVEKSMCGGELLIEPKSSANLTTEEFSVFLDKVEALAMTMGIILPPAEHHGVDR